MSAETMRIRYETAQRLFPVVGCGDASCVFGHWNGPTTNAGCSCLDGDRRDLRAVARQLAAIADDLAGRVAP